MNSKGFLIYAEGREFVKQAYLCAMSILASGNQYPVSIVTNNKVPKKFSWVFDKIIDIPWYKKTSSRFKTENRWKLYHVSPYEQTIVLDSDTLVLDNQEAFWEFLDNYDLYFPSIVFDYRDKPVNESVNYYRKVFTENSLPNLYNVVHYFRKSELAHEYFRWVELVTNNWELFYGNYCQNHYPEQPSLDITASIVSKILNIDDDVTNAVYDAPYITHMKPFIQKWENPPNSWQEYVGVYFNNDMQLKIGNFLQTGVFHYTENNFVSDDIIRKYELCLKK